MTDVEPFVVVVVPIEVDGDELGHPWIPGPLPVEGLVPGDLSSLAIVADKGRRETAFHRRVRQVLFGGDPGSSGGRYHLWIDEDEHLFSLNGEIRVQAAECLLFDAPLGRPSTFDDAPPLISPGLLCLHAVNLDPLDVGTVDTLNRVLRDRTGRNAFSHRLDEWLSEDCAVQMTSQVDRAPFTVAFGMLESQNSPRPFEATDSILDDWDVCRQWTWLASSLVLPSKFAPPRFGTDTGTVIELSTSWQARVLRDGAAFVALGTRSDGSADQSVPSLAFYARTIYLDALLLGLLESEWINRFADQVSDAALDPKENLERVVALDEAMTRFHASSWWQSIGQGSHADRILSAYQDEHHLAELVASTKDEVSDLVNHLRYRTEREALATAQWTDYKVGLVGVLFLPSVPIFTVWLGVSHSWPGLGVSVAIYSAVAGGLAVLTNRWRARSQDAE